MKQSEIFVYTFLMTSFYYLVNCMDIMSVLWDDDDIPAEEATILIRRLSQLPFTEEVKSDAWYKLLRYRSPQTLSLEDWETYEALIPYLPSDLLRSVNFSDESVLSYFGKQKFHPPHLSLVAEAVTTNWGSDILMNEELIVKMGNIFCGFSGDDLGKINASTLRSLLRRNFFQTMHGCSMTQLKILAKTVQKYTIIGPPRTWQPETVKLVGSLIAGLSVIEVRALRDRSFMHITPHIISITPIQVLQRFRRGQLRVLSKPSLLAWRRKVQDMRSLNSAVSSTFPLEIVFAYVLDLYI